MKLEPGYYKIRRKGRYLLNTNHYLRVWVNGKRKLYQIDSGLPQEGEEFELGLLDDYIIVKRLTGNSPIEVNSARISVEWKDEDGDGFTMRARNWPAFLNIFKQFPRVGKALGLKEKEGS